jgi:hypothetical protein
MSSAVETELPGGSERPVTVPAWVYRLDAEPPARHDGWRRAIRILHVRRQTLGRRRRGR